MRTAGPSAEGARRSDIHAKGPAADVDTSNSERLASLQVLRAVAALSIALHHALADAAALTPQSAATAGWRIASVLPAGVDLFFVISGFVMVFASRNLFARDGASATFLRLRLTRIVPLYWLVTTLFLLVAWIAPETVNSLPSGAGYVAASYFFIPALRPDGTTMPLVSLGWTLNYEMLFYAMFACAVVLPRRPAVVAIVTALAGAAVLAVAAPPGSVALRYWTNPIILEFAFGVLIAEVWFSGVRIGRGLSTVLLIAGVALIAFSMDRGGEDIALGRVLGWGLPAALIVAAATLTPNNRRLPRAMRPLVGLGDASYALYLTHPFAIRFLKTLWGDAGFTGGVGTAAFIGAALLAAVLLALAVYWFVERPILRLLRGGPRASAI